MPMVMKRPAVCIPSPMPTWAMTTLETCACGGALSYHHTVEAKCHDLIGTTDIQHILKQCCRRMCRKIYGHNFSICSHQGRKNTVKLSEMEAPVLFTNS